MPCSVASGTLYRIIRILIADLINKNVRNPYTVLDRPLGLKEVEAAIISMQLEMVNFQL
jgi:hypothetical protein